MLALVDLLLPFRSRFYYNSNQILFLWLDNIFLGPFPIETFSLHSSHLRLNSGYGVLEDSYEEQIPHASHPTA